MLGFTFLGFQAHEYTHAYTEQNLKLSTGVYGSTFFMLTGFHGLHVAGGLVAFVYLLIRTKLSKFTPAQATSAIVVSYYWHFVDIVWIGLFAVIEILP